MWNFFCILLTLEFVYGKQRIDPLVSTKKGLIRGLRAEDGDYYMFLGIPYAKVNESNPFGRSINYPEFDQIYNAYDDSAICPQIEEYTGNVIGTLDCLHLNVYVSTQASSRNKLPVLVWIHGGAFNTGRSGRYIFGPKYLIRHEIIVVTVNYRVGPYGFMCLAIPEVPGNQGLKDQLLALRWIKENIAAFGGDANKVTIMGESAGGSSVDLHLLSNNEKLYDKAIIHSSSLLKPGGISDTDPTPPLRIAEKLGFPTENIAEALQFLSQVDPQLVMGASSQLSINLRVCVEDEFDNVESVFTKHPYSLDIPKIKGMPILAGYNTREALLQDSQKSKDYFKYSSYFYDTLELKFETDEEFQELVDIVRHYYIGDEELTEDVRPEIIDFESDLYYNYPVQWSIRNYLKKGALKVYQYLFSYEGGRNLIKNRRNITMEGASHADELGYLFDPSDTYLNFRANSPSVDDQLVIDRMTTMWTNFIKYGDPTPETSELLPEKWVPVTEDVYNYMDINKNLLMKNRPFNDRLAFWELFFKANLHRLKGYNLN